MIKKIKQIKKVQRNPTDDPKSYHLKINIFNI